MRQLSRYLNNSILSFISRRFLSSSSVQNSPSFINQEYEGSEDNDVNLDEHVTGAKRDVSYTGHIQLTEFQRGLLSVTSGIMCIVNPKRPDLISTFGEASGTSALKAMHNTMMSDETGRRILNEKPRIRSHTIDFDTLRSMDEGTLGKSYINFLEKYNYSPDSRSEVRFVDDPELAYVMQRYREIHDLNHVILEQPTNMLGEVVVKWFEAFQTRLPLCVTGAIFGPLRLYPKQRQKYINTYLPYILKVGTASKSVMTYYFEENWSKTLSEVRKDLNIENPP